MPNVNSVVYDQSARRRIRDALVYQLGNITKAGGYNNDIVEIHTMTPSLEQMKMFPSIVVVSGDERSLPLDGQGSTFKVIQKDWTILIHAFLKATYNPTDAQDDVIQDIEQMVGEHFGLEHQDGKCTCFLAQILNSRPFGLKVNKPNCGVTFTLNVKYRQLRLDPTTKS